MTEAQQKAILEVCRNLISTGIAFANQPHLTEPEYSPQRGLSEIMRILASAKEASDANEG